LIMVGIMLLAFVAFRFGPSFMLLAARLVVPLAVISLRSDVNSGHQTFHAASNPA
jgi:hypothetical protein